MNEGTDSKPLFDLGKIVATPGALRALAAAEEDGVVYLSRHQQGDWGEIGDEAGLENERALREGGRLMSVFGLHTGVQIYVITEHDRSVTTILLPEDY